MERWGQLHALSVLGMFSASVQYDWASHCGMVYSSYDLPIPTSI